MKAWEKQTPTMKSAAIMKAMRVKLWRDLVEHPDWSAVQVKKTEGLIKKLTNQINKRSLSAEDVDQLLRDVKVYSRNYRRVADKMKKQKKENFETVNQIHRPKIQEE